MPETAARLLALLGLLQSRPDWTGAELAERLRVTDRTVRTDIGKLRALGYPVDARSGPGGRYRLGAGTRLPPLLLDEEEAVAVAVALGVGAGITDIAEISARAAAKLDQVLPHRLRRQVSAIRDAIGAGPEDTATIDGDVPVDAATLTAVAAAIRDHEELRFDYPGHDRVRRLEPYRLISWQRRWYVVAREARSDIWQALRLDWLRLRTPGGRRFAPSPLPGGDYVAFVLREVAAAGWQVHARIAVAAPAHEVAARINPTVGVVERLDDAHSVLVTGADNVEMIAVYIGLLGLDFRVTEPPELVAAIRTLAARYAAATVTS